MYEFRKLWRGQISPCERYIRKDSPYWTAFQKHGEALNSLYTMFTPEVKKQYEKVEQLSQDMQMIDTEEAFVQGFQLGARLLLDAVTEYRGSFYSLAENRAFEK